MNIKWLLSRRKLPQFLYKDLDDGCLIFYGAGNNMKYYIESLELEKHGIDLKICDRDAKIIKKLNGIDILDPVNELETDDGHMYNNMIITILDDSISKQLKMYYQKKGYVVYQGIERYLTEMLMNESKGLD